MKSVLALGAGGFIGSHLCEALFQHAGFQVTAVDIYSDKLDETNCDIPYYHLDLYKNKTRINELIHSHDIIINLIAIANPGIYVQDPLATFNLDFTENLYVVEQCVQHQKRLIQFSTSEVYGKSASIFRPDEAFEWSEDETHMILGPINKHRWIYANAKQLLERVIHAHGMQSGLDYTIIRPFNYIGPRIDFLPTHEEGVPRVFSYFIDALMYDKPMYLVNGGEQMRCYTDIRDATAAHLLLIENPNGQASQQIYNVGEKANEVSIRQLAEMMRSIWQAQFGTQLPPLETIDGETFYGKGYDDSDRRIPNNDKIRSLGWEVEYSVEEALDFSMKYYVEKYAAIAR